MGRRHTRSHRATGAVPCRRTRCVIGHDGTTRRTLQQHYWVITVPTFVVESKSGSVCEPADKSPDVRSVASLEALIQSFGSPTPPWCPPRRGRGGLVRIGRQRRRYLGRWRCRRLREDLEAARCGSGADLAARPPPQPDIKPSPSNNCPSRPSLAVNRSSTARNRPPRPRAGSRRPAPHARADRPRQRPHPAQRHQRAYMFVGKDKFPIHPGCDCKLHVTSRFYRNILSFSTRC